MTQLHNLRLLLAPPASHTPLGSLRGAPDFQAHAPVKFVARVPLQTRQPSVAPAFLCVASPPRPTGKRDPCWWRGAGPGSGWGPPSAWACPLRPPPRATPSKLGREPAPFLTCFLLRTDLLFLLCPQRGQHLLPARPPKTSPDALPAPLPPLVVHAIRRPPAPPGLHPVLGADHAERTQGSSGAGSLPQAPFTAPYLRVSVLILRGPRAGQPQQCKAATTRGGQGRGATAPSCGHHAHTLPTPRPLAVSGPECRHRSNLF